MEVKLTFEYWSDSFNRLTKLTDKEMAHEFGDEKLIALLKIQTEHKCFTAEQIDKLIGIYESIEKWYA